MCLKMSLIEDIFSVTLNKLWMILLKLTINLLQLTINGNDKHCHYNLAKYIVYSRLHIF